MKPFRYLSFLSILISCSILIKKKIPESELLKSGRILTNGTVGSEVYIQHLKLKNKEEAMSYAMERRLLLLRKFDSLAEPYFGTVNAKDCKSNLKTSILNKTQNGLSAVLQVPSLGKEHTIHDCLIQNNSDWAHIEFLTCGEDAYDIRFYTPIDQVLEYKQIFSCGVN